MPGDMVTCEAVFPVPVHAVILTKVVLPATVAAALRLFSIMDLVMNITLSESNPDTGLLIQQTFHLNPDALA